MGPLRERTSSIQCDRTSGFGCRKQSCAERGNRASAYVTLQYAVRKSYLDMSWMSPHHVLVIDDEEDIRMLATIILEMSGVFRVSTAESGDVGLDSARRDRPDAILLDYSMPDKDGPAIFAMLRADELTRSIPVIFLTGKAHGGSRAAVDAIGADGVIAKPVDPDSFADEVAAILRGLRPLP